MSLQLQKLRLYLIEEYNIMEFLVKASLFQTDVLEYISE